MRLECHLSATENLEFSVWPELSVFCHLRQTFALLTSACMRAASKLVVFVAFESIQLLDLVGPLEIFRGANELVQLKSPQAAQPYIISIITPGGKAVSASNGLKIESAGSLRRLRKGADTVVVPGALKIEDVLSANEDITLFVRKAAKIARRMVAICSGTFFFAEAGLLQGRKATTHWAGAELFRRKYPKIHLESDQIYIRHGSVYTSGGVTSGMDLALALVAEDLGERVALELARWFVMYIRRPGGQSQFSAPLRAQFSGLSEVSGIVNWILEHPDEDLSVGSLAKRARMSIRNFARVFRYEAGLTPAQFVAQARLERSCHDLVGSDLGIKSVAVRCGYGSEQSLRRAFQKQFGITPGEYRVRFRTGRPNDQGASCQ